MGGFFNFNIFDVLNQPAIQVLKAGIKYGAKAVTSAGAKEEHEDYKGDGFSEMLYQAEQGDVDAQFDVALYYASWRSHDKTMEWLNKAAENGHEQAQEILDMLQVD